MDAYALFSVLVYCIHAELSGITVTRALSIFLLLQNRFLRIFLLMTVEVNVAALNSCI
jgi:hypothetical protein